MQDNVIEITNLSLPYAFQKFNLSLERNKLTAITGPNSCGKTTIIKSIIGQIFTDNTIYIFSQELEYYRITELNIILKYIIPEEFTFFEDTIFEELKNSLSNLDIPFNIKQKKVKEIIKKFGLTKIQNKNIKELTTAQKIKTQLAKHLLQCPKILLLDDIFKEMSKEERNTVIEVLREYQKEKDLTIIMTTSNLEDTINCDYIYVIDNNVIAVEGKPIEVLQKDNILNRIGLELPFMIDLSVKLRDYDLIDDIDINMNIDRMVDILWK